MSDFLLSNGEIEVGGLAHAASLSSHAPVAVTPLRQRSGAATSTISGPNSPAILIQEFNALVTCLGVHEVGGCRAVGPGGHPRRKSALSASGSLVVLVALFRPGGRQNRTGRAARLPGLWVLGVVALVAGVSAVVDSGRGCTGADIEQVWGSAEQAVSPAPVCAASCELVDQIGASRCLEPPACDQFDLLMPPLEPGIAPEIEWADPPPRLPPTGCLLPPDSPTISMA